MKPRTPVRKKARPKVDPAKVQALVKHMEEIRNLYRAAGDSEVAAMLSSYMRGIAQVVVEQTVGSQAASPADVAAMTEKQAALRAAAIATTPQQAAAADEWLRKLGM